MEEIRKDYKWLSKMAFQCTLIFVFAIILSHLFVPLDILNHVQVGSFPPCFLHSLMLLFGLCWQPYMASSMWPAFETASHPPSSLAWMLQQCASMHKYPAESNMLRALNQNICRLVDINLLLRPFIRSKEELCLLDVNVTIATPLPWFRKTLPCSYLSPPGTMQGTRGRQAI